MGAAEGAAEQGTLGQRQSLTEKDLLIRPPCPEVRRVIVGRLEGCWVGWAGREDACTQEAAT